MTPLHFRLQQQHKGMWMCMVHLISGSSVQGLASILPCPKLHSRDSAKSFPLKMEGARLIVRNGGVSNQPVVHDVKGHLRMLRC